MDYTDNLDIMVNDVLNFTSEIFEKFPDQPIERIKALRGEYGFTLLDAKEIAEHFKDKHWNVCGRIRNGLENKNRSRNYKDKRHYTNNYSVKVEDQDFSVIVSTNDGTQIFKATSLDEARRVRDFMNLLKGSWISNNDFLIVKVVE